MTTTYDPHHPAYLDEADVRGELTEAFDTCLACRRCTDLCAVFPTLFEMLDHDRSSEAGDLTPARQDDVVESCSQCSLCALECPYTPERHEMGLDLPQLLLRATAMRRATGQLPGRDRTAARFLGRADLVGAVASATSPVSNALTGARPRSVVRTIVSAATGVSAVRVLPPFARRRFSTWFRERPTVVLGAARGRVTVFPTCLVEYQATGVGIDLVKVYERNGIECAVSAAGCCGAPSLHAGDLRRFGRIARKNVATLAAELRDDADLVVPQPTCAAVLRRAYPVHVGGPVAERVATRVRDAAAYLMSLHRRGETVLDTDFEGERPRSITYHAPCHLRGQESWFPARDLMKLTGADVEVVQQCSGVAGTWGLRAGHDDVSIPVAERLGARIDRAGGDVVAGDSHLANTVIVEQTGRVPLHPLQVMARAYGIAAEA